MNSQLLTSQGELDAALDRVLALAEGTIDLFDGDLSAMAIERPSRIAALQRVLAERAHQVRIVVQDGARVQATCPRLMRLFETHGHHFALLQAADSLLELKDSFVIADGRHALVRFHRDQPRGRLIEDGEGDVRPYATRFADIVAEGGHRLSARLAGL